MRIPLFCLVILGFAFVAAPVQAQKRFTPHAHKVPKVAPHKGAVKEDEHKKRNEFMWDVGDKVSNKLIGYIPGPSGTIPSHVYYSAFSAAWNLWYSALRTSITEDRELGHGEAWGIFLNSMANPTPVPIWGDFANRLWARFDLCKDRNVRDYPGLSQPEHQLLPKEARHAFYEEKYCEKPPDRRFDALRREARMKPPMQHRVASARVPAVRAYAMAQFPDASGWEAVPITHTIHYDPCAWPKFDDRGNEVIEQNCAYLYKF